MLSNYNRTSTHDIIGCLNRPSTVCRAPTQKGPQIIVTTVLGHAKKTRTVVLVGKSRKKKLKKLELQKRNSSSIWMFIDHDQYATSYQIHLLPMIPSYYIYNTYPFRKKENIRIVAPCTVVPRSFSPWIGNGGPEEVGPFAVQAHQGTGRGTTLSPRDIPPDGPIRW